MGESVPMELEAPQYADSVHNTKSSVSPRTGLLLGGGNATVRFYREQLFSVEKPEGQILDKVVPTSGGTTRLSPLGE